ncbi:MAG: hypothetical protein DCO95_00740 [Roseivirga sp. XM-24bin3]|nr:MAG: hypothetical protein DCO95_00740 [Roseivirga sp. XM-24bin3]
MKRGTIAYLKAICTTGRTQENRASVFSGKSYELAGYWLEQTQRLGRIKWQLWNRAAVRMQIGAREFLLIKAKSSRSQ